MIWQTLCKAIQRVESVRCKRRGHDPLMMRLVQRLVHTLVVQPAMDPVNAGVGEEDEQRELQPVVPDSWTFFCCVVEFGVPTNFGQKPRCCENGHDGEGYVCLLHLEFNLVLEVSWVCEGGFVEDEEVGS